MFATLDFLNDRWRPWFAVDRDNAVLPNLRVMSVSIPRSAEPPLEIIERILLSLPGQDTIEMHAVRKVTANSAQLC